MSGFDIHGSVLAGQAMVAPAVDAIKKWKELETTTSYNDEIMRHAFENKMIGIDELTKYQAASSTKKTGMAAAMAANMHADLRRREQEANRAMQERKMAQSWEIAKMAHAPDPNAGRTILHPETNKPIGIYGAGGNPQFFPREATEAADGPIQVDPFVDPTTQKPVPGMGIVRKTGQIGYFGALLGAGGGVPIETDPTTGMKFYRDAKGNPKPLDPTKVMTADLTRPEGEKKATGTPAATPLVAPQVGEVRRGYRFKGGDPATPESWEKVP